MKAVVLAGGKGTRLAPYTKVLPKPLMPIGDMPILEVILRQMKCAGIDDVVLTVGHLSELMRTFFQDGSRFGLHINYSYEDKPLGTAGPIALVGGLDETFLVTNGDVLTTLHFGELINFHKEGGAIATIAVHHRKVKIDLGVIQWDGSSQITGYIEKPSYDYCVSMGIYIFEPRVLDYIPSGQYLDFPDLVLKLIAAGEKVLGYEYEGYNYQSSVHTFAITDKCVTCHVFMTEYVGEPEEIPAYTGHTFEPQAGSCMSCHEDFEAFWTSDSSFDYRGVQSEMDSLMHVLEEKLMAASSEDSTTDAFLRAKFNWDFVHGEGSHGIHNTKYARALLQSSIAEFNPTAIEPVNQNAGIPLMYTLSQNYPNPFNPVTDIKFSIKNAGHVSLKIYDLLGRELYTLVDKEMSAGVYTARFNASEFASGIYIYRLVSPRLNLL